MIWFSSDFHFGHDKSFIYGPRGFDNMYDAAKTIIKNCNEVVAWDDDFYILGDCMLGNTEFGLSCLRQLPGYKHLIFGNHCTDERIKAYAASKIFVSAEWGGRLKYKHWTFLLSHYPQITENYQERHKVISLCGHSHTNNPFLHWDKGLIYHCEVDAHNLYPVNIDKIYLDISGKLQNIR